MIKTTDALFVHPGHCGEETFVTKGKIDADAPSNAAKLKQTKRNQTSKILCFF